MQANKRSFLPIGIATALLVSFVLGFACPREALAIASPWGAGTTYSAKTNTLTVKSGKHSIRSLTKSQKGRLYSIERLVIKGGTTYYNPGYGYLKSLTVSKGKLTSKSSIMVSGNMRATGGTISIASAKRNGDALYVMEDLVVTGGKITSKTTKENCTAIRVSGDMVLKKGSVTAVTKGKSAGGLQVSGYLKVCGGKLKSSTAGKYGTAVQVFGDLLMSSGSINATAGRDKAIHCFDLLKITGGTVTAKSASGEMAMDSGETAVVKPGCIDTIRGYLPEGARFAKNGVTYRVTDRYGHAVKVVKGSTGASSVKFGGVTYSVR